MLRPEYGKLLSQHTSLKIGGPAFCWLEPGNIDELLESVSLAEAEGKSLTIIGRGTNLLVQDRGFDGVIINLGKEFDYIEEKDSGVVSVGAATPVQRLTKACARSGLTGCEFLAGIPGSFGGAIFMNAGVRDIEDSEKFRETKDIVLELDVVDLKDKRRMTIGSDEAGFSYRSSGLDAECILGARIGLKRDRESSINSRIDSFMSARRWMRELGFASAGSVFKNPRTDTPAGRLIEECGLKGAQSGGAEISKVHANFIVNTGKATAKDVLSLIDLAKNSVKDKFDIDLELELRVI